METNNAPILVLGGTGHYGRHIVRCLLDRGEPVRVLSRNAAAARGVLGEQVEIVAGDITRQASVAEALAGARAIVVAVSAFSPKQIRHMKLVEQDAVLAVFEAAQTASISRVVYVSVYEVRQDVIEELDLESGRIKEAVETALAASDLDWTVLGAPPSTELFFSLIRGSRMVVPGGGPPALPTVSPVDLGQIAAQAVLRGDLRGKRIRLAGPEALSFPEAARRISAVVGRPIRFQKVPLLAFQAAGLITAPLNPYLHHLAKTLKMMNHHFTADVAAQALQDHRWLVDTFDYTPMTLEMEAERWMQPQASARRA